MRLEYRLRLPDWLHQYHVQAKANDKKDKTITLKVVITIRIEGIHVTRMLMLQSVK